jgi:hypothetical protein
MREHPIIEAIEVGLRRAGFMITQRHWTEAGDCRIGFRGMGGPFCHFSLTHELLMNAEVFDDDADRDAYLDDLVGYMALKRDEFGPGVFKN